MHKPCRIFILFLEGEIKYMIGDTKQKQESSFGNGDLYSKIRRTLNGDDREWKGEIMAARISLIGIFWTGQEGL